MKNFGYEEDKYGAALGDYHLWRRIFVFCRPHIWMLLLAVVLSLVITGATLTLPYLIQTTIDGYITNAELSLDQRLSGITTFSAVFLGAVLVLFITTFFQVVTLERIAQSIMHRIRQDLFAHMLALDPTFFDANPLGRLVTRLTNDIQNMHEMFTSVLVTIFNDLLRVLGILVVLFFINSRLALIMALYVPAAILITKLFARLARTQFRRIRNQLARLNSFLSESISGMPTLQIFGRQEESRQQHEELSQGYLQRNLQQIKLFGAFMPLTEFMSSTAIALILWFGGSEIIRQQLTLGELVAFLSYMRLFFQPLRELAQKYSIVQSAMASAERIFHLFDTRSSLKLPEKTESMENIKGNLHFKDIHFSYNDDEPIIKGINLQIRQGETVALVGTTGSGKTTLVSMLLRFYEPQKGEILLDGININRFALEDLRRFVGVVLQDIFILQDTLLANIVMDTGATREEVETILGRTGMELFVEKLPSGLDTMLGEGGQQLSTGEKQLLAFTRVLCRDPAILVLDEATAAIDTESENILEYAIDNIFAKRTSLVIAHRLSTIRRADKILVMEKGRIVEQGSHDVLMAAGGQYADLVAMDIKSGDD
ncbi:ABC transporter ATP-binding protein [Desulfopila inferna]|uniref:ABC transporter ATP-binding protein n=1 Tax=Desulfopila inferna TaxID=468528 RepID=UPI001964A287|nr:ABC transporter ATP-binding protein [Desulfopila inferna]MBM9605599.1 ABC transporter ATP-binding protein [Desulfopila inferna]